MKATSFFTKKKILYFLFVYSSLDITTVIARSKISSNELSENDDNNWQRNVVDGTIRNNPSFSSKHSAKYDNEGRQQSAVRPHRSRKSGELWPNGNVPYFFVDRSAFFNSDNYTSETSNYIFEEDTDTIKAVQYINENTCIKMTAVSSSSNSIFKLAIGTGNDYRCPRSELMEIQFGYKGYDQKFSQFTKKLSGHKVRNFQACFPRCNRISTNHLERIGPLASLVSSLGLRDFVVDSNETLVSEDLKHLNYIYCCYPVSSMQNRDCYKRDKLMPKIKNTYRYLNQKRNEDVISYNRWQDRNLPYSTELDGNFEYLDINKDGYISVREYDKMESLESILEYLVEYHVKLINMPANSKVRTCYDFEKRHHDTKFDVDGNNKIDRNEFQKFMKGETDDDGMPDFNDEIYLFNRFDSSKDGHLSYRHEFQLLCISSSLRKKLIEKYDAGNQLDGLSLSKYCKNIFIRQLDLERKGYITKFDVMSLTAYIRTEERRELYERTDKHFDMLDIDGNGKMTEYEFHTNCVNRKLMYDNIPSVSALYIDKPYLQTRPKLTILMHVLSYNLKSRADFLTWQE